MGEEIAEKAAEAFKARITGEPSQEASVELSQVDKLHAIYLLMSDEVVGNCIRQCLTPEAIVALLYEVYRDNVTIAQLYTIINLLPALSDKARALAMIKTLMANLEKDTSIPDWVKGLAKMLKVS